MKYPHLTLGIIFMFILMAILLALPASESHPPAYISVPPLPAQAPAGLEAGPVQHMSVEPALFLPVTGK